MKYMNIHCKLNVIKTRGLLSRASARIQIRPSLSGVFCSLKHASNLKSYSDTSSCIGANRKYGSNLQLQQELTRQFSKSNFHKQLYFYATIIAYFIMKLQIYLSRHVISLDRVNIHCTHIHMQKTLYWKKISKLAKSRNTKLRNARIQELISSYHLKLFQKFYMSCNIDLIMYSYFTFLQVYCNFFSW